MKDESGLRIEVIGTRKERKASQNVVLGQLSVESGREFLKMPIPEPHLVNQTLRHEAQKSAFNLAP